jgi:AraC family transcriptional regulator, transcriptional activator of pobA
MQTAMETIIHHNISDLYKTLGLPIEQDIDFTIMSIPDIHPQIPFKSPKLRADYFSFILTKEGSGTYYLDENKFPYSSQTFYFTNPGHLKSYELKDAREAFIITLTEKFLRENINIEIFSEFPFLLAEIVPPQKLPEDDFEEFEILYKQIANEFEKNSTYKSKILGNLFTILLLKIKEKFWVKYNPIEEGTRNSQIVKSFKRLLESEFRKVIDNEQVFSKLQAQYLAEQLNLHPNYLNSVIKSKTGKTVNDWISYQTTIVAKVLLLSDSYSSKEIAYKLGFSEPTHFSRFFKKQTQLSPNDFRKSNKLNTDL